MSKTVVRAARPSESKYAPNTIGALGYATARRTHTRTIPWNVFAPCYIRPALETRDQRLIRRAMRNEFRVIDIPTPDNTSEYILWRMYVDMVG